MWTWGSLCLENTAVWTVFVLVLHHRLDHIFGFEVLRWVAESEHACLSHSGSDLTSLRGRLHRES